jgi:molybdate transport system ATP-binding protein
MNTAQAPQRIEAQLRLSLGAFTLAADLSLPGEGVTALFGPSGSGKTSLLRCLAGLQRAAQGRLVINGETWQDESRRHFVPPHRRPLGYVFQDANLFPHLDVRGNLEFGRRRVPAAARRVSWEQAIGLLGIGHLLARGPERLSGGERQRVAIARALLCSPRLLLLDEPLASLDSARKKEVLPYLERLHEGLSIPMIYVSHAADEVARLADHLVVMDGGRVLASGPLAETLARLDLPIRLGNDAGVVLAGTVAERDERFHLARVALGTGSVWVRDPGLAPGHRARVRILARDVSVALRPAQDTSIQNMLAASVESFGDDEHPALVLVRLVSGSDVLLARLTRRSADRLALEPGMPVVAQIKAVALL